VHDWIERTLGVASWPLVRAVTGAPVEREWDGDAGAPQGSLQSHERATASARGNGEHGADTATTIRACLAQLRIASLERLVREVSRVKPEASRAEIVSTLEAMSDWVRWFGRAIVAVREQEAR
jgi:hypothetical protein